MTVTDRIMTSRGQTDTIWWLIGARCPCQCCSTCSRKHLARPRGAWKDIRPTRKPRKTSPTTQRIARCGWTSLSWSTPWNSITCNCSKQARACWDPCRRELAEPHSLRLLFLSISELFLHSFNDNYVTTTWHWCLRSVRLEWILFLNFFALSLKAKPRCLCSDTEFYWLEFATKTLRRILFETCKSQVCLWRIYPLGKLSEDDLLIHHCCSLGIRIMWIDSFLVYNQIYLYFSMPYLQFLSVFLIFLSCTESIIDGEFLRSLLFVCNSCMMFWSFWYLWFWWFCSVSVLTQFKYINDV